tara:strand:- start:350 stop:571 length:222 start_codon:yes stop_codon:yes gene_type:complete
MDKDTKYNHSWWDNVFDWLDKISVVEKVSVKRHKNTLVIIKEDDFNVDDGRDIDKDTDNIMNSLLVEYKGELL